MKEIRKGFWRSPYLFFLLLSFSSKEDASQEAAYCSVSTTLSQAQTDILQVQRNIYRYFTSTV